jgi:hypothetical protein
MDVKCFALSQKTHSFKNLNPLSGKCVKPGGI